MARRGYIPTTQEVQRLYERAEAGDPSAAEELGNLNNKLAKRANERMRDIERRGMEGTAAYNRVKYWLSEEANFSGNDYFSQSRKLSLEDAVANIEAVSEYLRAQTSTAAGEMQRRKNISDKLEEMDFFDDVEDPEQTKKQLMEFFDTDAWSDIRKNNRGGTNLMVAEAVDALSAGALVGDLKRAFKDYQRGADTDYIEIWENWTSNKMYYRGGSWHELKRPRR